MSMIGKPNAAAGSMINEDHLKKIIAKTGGKAWKCSDNKLLPRSQHSPFGDFPASHMPKKAAKVQTLHETTGLQASTLAGSPSRKLFRIIQR